MLLCTTLVLAGCSSLDRLVFGPDPEPDERALEVTELDADEAYPPVSSVPQRPQLSHTVEQEREIVDALISDRENALYTRGLVRYRSGVSRNPPPPPPPGYGPLRGEDVIGPEVVVGPETVATFENEATSSDEANRTLSPEAAEFDDGGLDDFVRGLVDETAADPAISTETALIDRRRLSGRIPGRKGDESAFERLFLWVAEQFGAGSADDGEGEATTQEQPAEGGARPGDAPPPADAVPKLKPDESADPPAPAPSKPDEADEARDRHALSTTRA